MPQARASIIIRGDADQIFAITNDIARWPELFKEYSHARVLSLQRDGRFAKLECILLGSMSQLRAAYR